MSAFFMQSITVDIVVTLWNVFMQGKWFHLESNCCDWELSLWFVFCAAPICYSNAWKQLLPNGQWVYRLVSVQVVMSMFVLDYCTAERIMRTCDIRSEKLVPSALVLLKRTTDWWAVTLGGTRILSLSWSYTCVLSNTLWRKTVGARSQTDLRWSLAASIVVYIFVHSTASQRKKREVQWNYVR
jgi:hypothetical protein